MSAQKFSFQDEKALSYVKAAAESLLEQGRSMIEGLPVIMYKAGQAVNASIKDVFSECDFHFALFVEKDDDRPGRKFLGVSVLCSLQCLDVSTYYLNSDNAGLINFLTTELTADELTKTLYNFMKSVYDHVTK